MRYDAILVAGTLLLAPAAHAHWCDDLWASSFNLVVRPESDSVNVPATGSASVALWVQNNMGYPLAAFRLHATAAEFNVVSLTSDTPKVATYLMPGERLRHVLTVSRRGTATTLDVDTVTFTVEFGSEPPQDQLYGPGATAVVVRHESGTLDPPPPVSLPSYSGDWVQGLHLQSSAIADFRSVAQGVSALLAEYCAGRDSWQSNGAPVTATYCPNESTTTCPPAGARTDTAGTKYDWQHLWSAGELAYRRGALTRTQLDSLRRRLMCGWNDEIFSMKAFTTFVLGYVGAGDAAVSSFLQAKVTGGTGPEQATAKAALLLMGERQHRADVVTALSAADVYVQMVAGAALGVADADDAAVNAELVPRARWLFPEGDESGFVAAHLLNLVAWHRRGWRERAADPGAVSFYGGAADATAPAAPTGVSCDAAEGRATVSFNPVAVDEGGGTEVVGGYLVYWGTAANGCAATCTRPGMGFDYQHVASGFTTTATLTGLASGTRYFFAAAAVDAYGNQSVFSAETSCTTPIPARPPVAAITCQPSAGEVPVTFACDAALSSDPDGDLAHTYFSIDGGAEVAAPTASYTFNDPGSHTAMVRVVDATGLADTATQLLVARAPASENQPPTAVADATPQAGPAPLTVQLSGAGSSDPEGQSLTYAWRFGDGGESTAAGLSHTYFAPGTYVAALTVTDGGTPARTGTATVVVTATDPAAGNHPPSAAAATVEPTSGPAPLTVTLDAGGCSDPDGDGLTYDWSVSGADGPLAAFVGATETYTFASPGAYAVRLRLADDRTPALSDERTLQVTVTSSAPNPDASQAPCGCDGSRATALVVVAAAGLLAWRARGRRRA